MTNHPRGCVMRSGLYLRYNGQLPCWDHIGENRVLRTLTREGLESGREKDVFWFPALIHIRSSFANRELPFPDDCPRCAMLGHLDEGTALRPAEVRVLHVEASYYCHLSCPQCIPATERRRRMPEPHTLDPALFEAFLRRLKADGVSRIQYLYFEGRGDPLVNPALGKMVELAKVEFPGVFTNVVTHGNYPFKPWLVTSGLDLLTLSVDGARPDSYAMYRVGGDLHTVLELMRRVCVERAQMRSRLRVMWRYILFEWNDSDEELCEAARMATSFGIELRFMRTHSEGRSRRFGDRDSLALALRRLGIDAAEQTTFELKSEEGDRSTIDNVEAEHVASLLGAARTAHRQGDEPRVIELLEEALARDPGVTIGDDQRNGHDLLRSCMTEILSGARWPSTLCWTAALCREWGDTEGAERLLERYLALAPAAVDRDIIAAERHLLSAIAAMETGDQGRALDGLRDAIRLDPGLAIRDTGLSVTDLIHLYLDEILARECAPSTLCALAHLCDRHLHDRQSARRLFLRYLEYAADAPNRAEVEARVRRLNGRPSMRDLAAGTWRRLVKGYRHKVPHGGSRGAATVPLTGMGRRP